MLKIEHFTKSYGSFRAVEDLSLEIPPGVIYGFIGHNGAGKTTTLKAAAGILKFEHGDICIDNISIKKHPVEYKRRIAYIPDDPQIYDFMTGIQFLNFVADIYNVRAEERLDRIQYYAGELGMSGVLGQPIGSYSHGMKQKLALISAWLHAPELIIMDEPFVGLDPLASHQLKQMMREHCDRGGAVFFSTHVLEVAERLCDFVAIIKNGRLVKAGAMSDIRGDASLEEVFLELEDNHV